MTVQEFIKRCEREYYDKEPHKKVLKIINGVVTVIGVFVVLILLLNINIIPALIVAALVGIYDLLQYYVIDARFHRGVIENYNSYKDCGVDHPYSFLYPGETYPFGRKDTDV